MKIAIDIGSARHVLELNNESLDLSGYPSQGQKVLQAAFDRGEYHAYTPPAPPPPQPEPPNWPAFRMSLFDAKSFRQWAALVPADWREDLKICAVLANGEALQNTYNQISGLYKPSPTSAAEWQRMATQHRIPVTF